MILPGTANNAGAILVLGRDLVVVPKLIHPIPPATPSPESSPERHQEEMWMQVYNCFILLSITFARSFISVMLICLVQQFCWMPKWKHELCILHITFHSETHIFFWKIWNLVGGGRKSLFAISHSCWGSHFTLDSWYLYFGLRWSVGPLVYGSTTSAIVCTKLCSKSTSFLW